MQTSRFRRLAPLLLLVLFGIVAFFPGLGGRFVFDDYANIVSNPRVHMQTLDWASIERASRGYEPGAIGRPLATISFAIDHYFGGTDPKLYKISNLAVHIVNGLLVFWLTLRLLGLAWPGREHRWAAFAISVAWVVHPLQVSSVLYIVQRMETLATTFVLLGMLAYLRGRALQREGDGGWGWLAGSGLLAGLGLLSKESALLFPVYTLALEVTLLRFAAADESVSRLLRASYGIGVVVGIAVFVLVLVPHFAGSEAYRLRDFSAAERLLTQLRVLPMYLGWILVPLPGKLLFYYDHIEASRSLFEPVTTVLGGVFLASLLVWAFLARRAAPLFALGVFWFFGAQLLTSNVIALELAFEHRNYFAMLGVLLAVAEGVRRLPAPDGPGAIRVATSVLLAGLFALCLIRSATWGNPFLLASDMAQRNPQSARAANDYGEQLMLLADGNGASPFYSLAQAEFTRGAALPNASILPEQALILFAASHGQPADPAWWDNLCTKLRTRPVTPQDLAGVVGLMRHRANGMDLDDKGLSRAYATLADRITLKNWQLAQFADHALTKAGDPELAERLFVKSVEASADDPEYIAQLAQVLVDDGHERQATAVIAAAKRLGVNITR